MHRNYLPVTVRVWERIDVRGPDECWLWTGARFANGYGVLKDQGRPRGPHRVALISATEDHPDLNVLHSCDVRLCCNPAHLRWGTQGENVRDTVSRGRHYRPSLDTHCRKGGHRWTEDNTRWRTNSNGRYRSCRACENAGQRARRAQKED